MLFHFRLLDLFRTVFPCTNKVNRHIMDTEKVHSIKHCHVDVANYANPINCSSDGPAGGHKTGSISRAYGQIRAPPQQVHS